MTFYTQDELQAEKLKQLNIELQVTITKRQNIELSLESSKTILLSKQASIQVLEQMEQLLQTAIQKIPLYKTNTGDKS